MSDTSKDEDRGERRDPGDSGDPPSPFGLFPLLVIVALVVVGWFLIDTLSKASKTQDCVQSGRRNCAPIEAPER